MRAGRDLGYAIIWVVATAAIVAAWRKLWFLTDDAFITFRYASNALRGLGYVWNPPPFRPVEGYTSFLWLVLLHGSWRLFGIEPPRAANLLSLFASLASVALVIIYLARARLSERAEAVRLPLIALVVVGLVSNRTFLAWTSSGMEAALFAAAFGAWLIACLLPERHTLRTLTLVSAAASVAALTRPEGLLTVAGTIALLTRASPANARRAALPLLTVVAHLAWRRAFYGAWLPNTWQAKLVAAWPSLGLRYLALFVLEYGLLPWLIVVVIALLRRWPKPTPSHAVVALVCAAHVGYYVFIAGGDLFEFRAFCHLIPFIYIAWVFALDHLGASRRALLGWTSAFVIWTLPLQWLQFTGDWPTRLGRSGDAAKIATRLPYGLRWYGGAFDALQESLTSRGACLRYALSRDYLRGRVAQLPPRAVGAQISNEGFPIREGWAVGYLGWVLPSVAIVDHYGLTDSIVAKTPTTRSYIAHDRVPPAGYIECFDPNVQVRPTAVTVRPRETPMTAERIVACESRSWF